MYSFSSYHSAGFHETGAATRYYGLWTSEAKEVHFFGTEAPCDCLAINSGQDWCTKLTPIISRRFMFCGGCQPDRKSQGPVLPCPTSDDRRGLNVQLGPPHMDICADNLDAHISVAYAPSGIEPSSSELISMNTINVMLHR
ncbi:hypothetical protein PM082_007663 [Marasmius tenuissimus]|nr:hypothetical protein PM082_007663 [Marasmius tenuissimus]